MLRFSPTTTLLFFAAICSVMTPMTLRADAALWTALKSGDHLVMIRHALAPGTGDPEGFKVDDCTTQRNLNGAGREQARRTGDLFRVNGIASAEMLSSQWCRCLETAKLMDLGPIDEKIFLNNVFTRPQNRASQKKAFETWLKTADLSRPTVLVSHATLIAHLTGAYMASGEMVFVKRKTDGGIEVIGRIRTD